MTGRGAGYCGGYLAPGSMNPVPGRGFGRGRGFGGGGGFGRGRGFGRGPASWGAPYGSYAPAYGPAYPPSYGPKDEVTALKNQARYFEEALQETKKRIEEMESTAEEE
jgi:hypothetical protein